MPKEAPKVRLKKLDSDVEPKKVALAQKIYDICRSKAEFFGLLGSDSDLNAYIAYALMWRMKRLGNDSKREGQVYMSQRKGKTVLLLRVLHSELKNDPFDLPQDEDFILSEADVLKAYSIVEEIAESLKLIDDDTLWEKANGKYNPEELSARLAEITPDITLPAAESYSNKILRQY